MTCFRLSTGTSLRRACKEFGVSYYQAVKWIERGAITCDEALAMAIKKKGDFGGKYFRPDGKSYFRWFCDNNLYPAYARFLYYARKTDPETAVQLALNGGSK